MPRKSSSQGSTDARPEFPVGRFVLADDAPWGGFINIRLDDDHKDAFEVWFSNHHPELYTLLGTVIDEGGKVGVSYDGTNQSYVATLTGALVAGDARRYCMTTRAGSQLEVLMLMLWKHTQLAKGEYGNFLPRTGTFKTWG